MHCARIVAHVKLEVMDAEPSLLEREATTNRRYPWGRLVQRNVVGQSAADRSTWSSDGLAVDFPSHGHIKRALGVVVTHQRFRAFVD